MYTENVTLSKVSQKEKISTEELSKSDGPLGYRRAQDTVDGTIPRKVVLGCVRELPEQVREQASKQCSPMASASVPVLSCCPMPLSDGV